MIKHGNHKYDFSPLKIVGGQVTAKPANLFALKTAVRTFVREEKLGIKAKRDIEYKDLTGGRYLITRIA